eukprot:PITA_24816
MFREGRLNLPFIFFVPSPCPLLCSLSIPLIPCHGRHQSFSSEFLRIKRISSQISGTTMKKTVVSVDIFCAKCKRNVMKKVATLNGVTSIEVDASKNTATVIGVVDPVEIVNKLRKLKKNAEILSVGPVEQTQKKKETKGEEVKKKENKEEDTKDNLPRSCPKCDVWYMIDDQIYYNPCSIM